MHRKSKVLTKIDYEEKKLVFEQMDIKKFMQSSKMRFKDGSLVYTWFNYHKLNIKRSSDDLSLSITKQYQDYQIMQEEKKKEDMLLKKLEFEQMDDKKFMQSSKMRFKDGSFAYTWFISNKFNLTRSSDELSLSIIRQYQAIQEEKENEKEKIFLKRLSEFEKASIEKFDSISKLKFNDGHLMFSWFVNNRKKIEDRKDELSLSIMKQFCECKPLRRLIKLSFEDKLSEFEKANLDKFDVSKEIKFSDGTSMIIWFRNHKIELEERNDELSNSILNQYLLAKRQRKNYDAKLMEFYKADLSKFNIALSKRFSDGTVMSFWYYNNREEIKNSNDDISKEIVRQHEEYINGNKTYVDDSLNDIKKNNK